jgi:hypothetical protein
MGSMSRLAMMPPMVRIDRETPRNGEITGCSMRRASASSLLNVASAPRSAIEGGSTWPFHR